MYRNYLKIAWRNLTRRKGHALINIGGLAIGIAVCILIFIVVQFELSFDDYHQKKDRIYRVLTEYHHANTPVFYGAAIPYALPEGIKSALPQIEKVAAFYAERNTQLLIVDDSGKTTNKFKEKSGVFVTEPNLFDIYDFEWLAGNASVLKDPNNVVLSRETAIKYFGRWEEAMGKTIKWNNKELLKVTGILNTIPKNSDLQVKLLIAYGTGYTSNFLQSSDWDGTDSSFGCFVLLPNNVTPASVDLQLKVLSKENKVTDNEDSHVLQPLDQIHFDTAAGNFSNRSISKEMIQVLWIVAGFILLIACVNFINLSTALAVNRAKEIGIRKVVGSSKLHLRVQFLTETFLIVILADLLALVIVSLSLKQIGLLIDLPLTFNIIQPFKMLFFLVSITLAVTLLAGFYPSFVLAKFNPINVLKSKIAAFASGGIALRRSLVVFQFIIAQALIIATIIVVNQMDFFSNQSLGFEKDAIVNVSIPNDSTANARIDYLRNALSAINGVNSVSFSSSTPMEEGNSWGKFTFDKAVEENEFYSIRKRIDHEFLTTYQLELVAGRNFLPADETLEFLINETLVKKLGINDPQEALNKEIRLDDTKGLVVGVVKDFQERSLKDNIAGVFMFPQKSRYNLAGIKLHSIEALGTIKEIENLWNETFPDFVFEYNFLDDKIAGYYEQEKRLSHLYQLAAGVAIFLSCLGLFGLASFMIMQRIKEAGVRKILGATKTNLVYLFSREFIVLIGIAFCIAAPLSWYFMNQWLEAFTYHINISWDVFVIGGTMTMLIASATVSFQAFKVANENPVNSLRAE
ncbi:ABC transporter permease [uncultured Cyclobacterium sp.]|mgnify:CR=1 FL=1|uniref:ABC transporter permease n=1 Tax=uncultured Cyclobacterium sp. TaxID=453820 RepID=UPI0030EBC338|tara:strand:+ start:60961 stop:63366 length:2406 start_codon:yes stop_codon:yes gene_type:complete